MKRKTCENSKINFEVKLPSFPDQTFNILDYGAVDGGLVMNTEAFARAIQACAEAGGGKVVVPAGLWLTGPITLKNNVNLHLEQGALVKFSPKFEDYPLIETNWEGNKKVRCMSPINGKDLDNIAITGKGIFDGSGEAWRMVKRDKLTVGQWKKLVASGGVVEDDRLWWPSQQAMNGAKLVARLEQSGTARIEDYAEAREFLRPVLVSLIHCKKVLLDGPVFRNSPGWNIHPLICEDVTIRNITAYNHWYAQNGDSLDLESCRNVMISDSIFDGGDDGICMKSGKNEEGRKRGIPTENVMIKDCLVYHGHGGFVIGSEMSGGVRNVHVSDCTFIGTDIGIRFKSTRGRGGVIEDIYINRVKMINIANEAIGFNLFYERKNKEVTEVPVTEETPIFRNIHLKDVVCRGAKKAIVMLGLPEMPIHHITMENVSVSADEGLICSEVQDITLTQVDIYPKCGPVMKFNNSKNIEVNKAEYPEQAEVFLKVEGKKTAGIKLMGVDLSKARKELELGAEVPAGAVIRP